MKAIIEMLERKRNQLNTDYQFHLDSVRRMANDSDNVKAITFEQNMISHLVEMNSIKNRLREIDDQLIALRIQ